jgi:hypothetical protein
VTDLRTDICVMTHRQDPERPRPALDGLYLCYGHRQELERLIAEMPGRADDLDRAAGAGGGRGDGTHSGISIDPRAAEHRSHMAGVLASWCRLVAEERGVTPPASADLYRTAPWLTRHIDWCAANRWVDEMLLELRRVTGQALGIIDIPVRRVPLGAQCLVHADGERCGGIITIVVCGDEWTARCSACEGDQEATQYLRGMQAGWMSTPEVIDLARVFGVDASEDVVRQWKHRRKIEGRDTGRQTMYDVGSVLRYLAGRQAKRERISA